MEDDYEESNEASSTSSSSREEFGMASELTESQKKALQELKKLIQDGFENNELTSFERDHATIWGVPLLGDKSSDIIILKFLKASSFKVLDAYAMIKNTLLWRNEVGIESLLEEDLGIDYKSVMFTHGYDKEGCPVWYLVLEDVLSNNLSHSKFIDEQIQRKFLRRLIQFTERNTRNVVLSTRATNSILLVIDIDRKSLTRYGNRDLYNVIYKFLQLLCDFYPELVAKQLWINVSWWYRYYFRVYKMVFDIWSTNQVVVFSSQSKTTETLFKYISPAHVPVKYGGLSRDNEEDFHPSSADETVFEVTIKPDGIQRESFHYTKSCSVLWQLRMKSWDAIYDAKFVPDMKGSYIEIISRPRKLTAHNEPVISEGFTVDQPGKLVLTIHNTSSKKKKLLIRVQVMASRPKLEPEPSLHDWLLDSDHSDE